jgi:hypothetical protein
VPRVIAFRPSSLIDHAVERAERRFISSRVRSFIFALGALVFAFGLKVGVRVYFVEQLDQPLDRGLDKLALLGGSEVFRARRSRPGSLLRCAGLGVYNAFRSSRPPFRFRWQVVVGGVASTLDGATEMMSALPRSSKHPRFCLALEGS